jgi:hypothetical protein
MGVDLKDLSALHRQIAGDLVQAISATAPRDTGRLAGSFKPRGTRTTAKAVSSLVYAPVIQYGWPGHGIEAQNYADRALATAAPRARQKYDDGMKAICRKAER